MVALRLWWPPTHKDNVQPAREDKSHLVWHNGIFLVSGMTADELSHEPATQRYEVNKKVKTGQAGSSIIGDIFLSLS